MPSKTDLMLRRREAPSRSTQFAHAARPGRSGAAGGGAGGLFGFLGAGLRLGLWRRFVRGFADRRLFDDPGIAEETRYPVAGLRADPEPMLDALLLQGHAVGVGAIEHR